MRIRPLIVLPALIAFVLPSCSKQEAVEIPPPVVTVTQAVEQQVQDWDEYTGRLVATNSVEIRPRVSGYLTEIHFEDGDLVKKGQILFTIDPRPYQAELERAQGNLANAQAQLKLASVEFDRAKQLRDRNVTSAGDFDQKSAAFLGAQAAVQTATADVSSAQLNVEFCSITSPIEGRASLANITVGNLVSPSTQTPLTTVKSINPIYAYADVDERSLLRYTRYYMGKDATAEDIDKVKVPIELALQDEEGFPHKGYIDFLDNTVDPSTGTIRLRGIFENNGLLGPGLFVRVRIPSGDPRQAVLVPERSIGTDQGQKFVYIVNKDNVVVYRPVELGRVHQGLQVITKGVAAGETVIVDGLLKARPGTKVTPKELPPENAETKSEAQPQNGGDAK